MPSSKPYYAYRYYQIRRTTTEVFNVHAQNLDEAKSIAEDHQDPGHVLSKKVVVRPDYSTATKKLAEASFKQ